MVASLVVDHRLWSARASIVEACGLSSWDSWTVEHGLNSRDTQALLLLSVWGLHRPGIEPGSSLVADKFFTTEPPGKSYVIFMNINILYIFRSNFIIIFGKYYSFTRASGKEDCKGFACSAGDPGSIPGTARSPGEGNDYPLQYSCLESSMDRGAWQGAAKSQT